MGRPHEACVAPRRSWPRDAGERTRVGRGPSRMCAILAPTPVVAQSAPRALPSDARWAPWLGCWSPVSFQRTTQDVQVCILPTDDRTGEGWRPAADQSVLEEPVIADGAPHVVTEGNCEGRRQTHWARNQARC
jgi:hypothetical protein